MLPLRAFLSRSLAARNVITRLPGRNATRIGRRYTTDPGPMPKWNPYPGRGPGLAAKLWFRADGTPRSKLKGALFVSLSAFTLIMFNAGLDLLAEYERAAFLLAYLVLAQQVDATYSKHDFESLESTKEYFYKLCRALPHDEDAEGEDDTVEQFIRLIELTIDKATNAQKEGGTGLAPEPTSSDESSVPSTSDSNDRPRGYLSHLASDVPALEAIFTSPNPDPLQAIHAIMSAYAGTLHELLEKDLNQKTLLACAQAALMGFQITVTALGAVSEKVGVVKSQDAFGKELLLRSGKGGDGAALEKKDKKDDYESIG